MKRKLLIIPLIVIIAMASYYYHYLQRPDKLTIGLFAGNPWSDTNFNIYDVIDEVIEQYQARYGIEVEYVSGVLQEDYSNHLNSLIVAGKEPDIYLIFEEDFTTLANTEALVRLDGLIDRDDNFNLDNYYQAPLKAGEFNGIRYALPVDCNLDLLFVNETLLEQEGIVIDDQLDLDEFYHICQQVTKDTDNDGVIDQFGCSNYDLADILSAFGIDFFSQGDFFIDLDKTKAALEYFKKLNALNGRSSVSLDDYDLGHVAFAKLPFSQFRTYRFYPYNLTKYSTFKWDCINLPSETGNSGRIDTLLAGISARVQNKSAAYNFIKLLSNDAQVQQDYFATSQGISPLSSVVNSLATSTLLHEQSLDGDFALPVIDRAMTQALISKKIPNYDFLYSQAIEKLNQTLRSDEDIDLVLINVQKEMNELMIQTNK